MGRIELDSGNSGTHTFIQYIWFVVCVFSYYEKYQTSLSIVALLWRFTVNMMCSFKSMVQYAGSFLDKTVHAVSTGL